MVQVNRIHLSFVYRMISSELSQLSYCQYNLCHPVCIQIVSAGPYEAMGVHINYILH